MLNTALYAVVGAGLSMVVSAMAGYALAKYRFHGRAALLNLLLAGVLMPGVILAELPRPTRSAGLLGRTQPIRADPSQADPSPAEEAASQPDPLSP